MTNFDRQFTSGAFGQLLLHHGEWINYIPDGGAKRPVLALVDRRPPELFNGSDTKIAFIRVKTYDACAPRGIESANVNSGRDKVEVSRRKGADPEELSVYAPPEEDDAGVTSLRVA